MPKKKYVDYDGLSYYNSKLQQIINGKVGSDEFITQMGLVNGRIDTTNSNLGTLRTNTESSINTLQTKDVLHDNSISTLQTKDSQHDSAIATLNSEKASKTEVTQQIATAISSVTQFDYQIVQELPEIGVKGVIYLVAEQGSSEEECYREYIWVESEEAYESLGYTNEVDLDNYVTFDDTITRADIEAMFSTPVVPIIELKSVAKLDMNGFEPTDNPGIEENNDKYNVSRNENIITITDNGIVPYIGGNIETPKKWVGFLVDLGVRAQGTTYNIESVDYSDAERWGAENDTTFVMWLTTEKGGNYVFKNVEDESDTIELTILFTESGE